MAVLKVFDLRVSADELVDMHNRRYLQTLAIHLVYTNKIVSNINSSIKYAGFLDCVYKWHFSTGVIDDDAKFSLSQRSRLDRKLNKGSVPS